MNPIFLVEISGFPGRKPRPPRQGAMEKVGHFTWASNVSLSKYTKAKFAPYVGGDGKGWGVQLRLEMGIYDILYIYITYRQMVYIYGI